MLSFGSLFLGGRLIPFGGGNCFVLFPSGFGLSLGNGLGGGLGGVDLMWLDSWSDDEEELWGDL